MLLPIIATDMWNTYRNYTILVSGFCSLRIELLVNTDHLQVSLLPLPAKT